MKRIFLNPKTRLVAAVSDWLATQARATPSGALSLSHLLVVVPTRQAGRRLRQSLAQHSETGCLSPLIRLPAQLIAPAHPPVHPVAPQAEALGLLAKLLLDLDLSRLPNLFPPKGLPTEKRFHWALGAAGQFIELWTILQENALTIADVAERVESLLSGEDLDIEIARWEDLARLERLFFSELQRRNRTPGPLLRQLAVADPLLPEGVETIVLPSLADAQPALYPTLERLAQHVEITVLIHADPSDDKRFDLWGRPEPGDWLGEHAPALPLEDDQIRLASNSAEQARLAADLFASVAAEDAPPALGMADDTLFNELQSAFLASGLSLHNPAAYPLAASSLGRLISQFGQLRREARFSVLAAFLREADVMHWLEHRAPSGHSHADLLRTLDRLQNAHLPQALDSAIAFSASESKTAPEPERASWTQTHDTLQAVGDLLDPHGRSFRQHLTAMLQTLFKPRLLQERNPGDRELAAAAEATLTILNALESDLLNSLLDESQQTLLFETLLASASFQLEPETADTLLTEGWLELAWNPAHELVLTGFNEGSVPDAIVGHAFLPDRLRQGLGLTSNERRTARDTFLLRELLVSRPPNAVHILLERLSAHHDVRKPSRLLFLCDDATLTIRAKKLFSDPPNTAAGHHRALPAGWRLRLPLPSTPPDRLSVTAFKAYLACPFTFYLRHILKMAACDDRVSELDAFAFGSLCHDALETFGLSEFKDSRDPETITHFLHQEVWRTMRARYGEPLPAALHLQASAACRRLSFFAIRQAQLSENGWRIVATERKLHLTERGMQIRGRADRIDRNELTGEWRIIDYKTWDRIGKNSGIDTFSSASKADLLASSSRGFEAFPFNEKTRVWTDLQLPLYLLMSQIDTLIPAQASVTCGYFVLGETEAETDCLTWDFAPCRENTIDTLRKVIDLVRSGIYWPPSPKNEWSRDYGALILDTPSQSVSSDWIADQEARLSNTSPTRTSEQHPNATPSHATPPVSRASGGETSETTGDTAP